MNYGRRRGPYRARDGAILGVIKGLAEYFSFPVFWMRVIGVFFMLATGFWPAVFVYLIVALIMKPTPREYAQPCGNQGSYESGQSAQSGRYSQETSCRPQPSRAQQLKKRFDRLEQRIRRMEDVVTSREFEWDSRMGRRRQSQR